jgi:molybdopterin-guanine dinucleotide biosynthesis protein A
MNAFILTGGKSARMQREKALLSLGGRTFVDIAAGLTAPLFGKVFTVGKPFDNARLSGNVEDSVKGAGPLAGIHAALSANDKEWGFFIGIDYPLVDPSFVLGLARFVPENGECDGVVPIAPDGLHPLLAFYSRRCIPAAARCLAEGNNQVICMYRAAKIRYVRAAEEIPGLKPGEIDRIFSNVNDLADYERVKNMYKKG